MSGPLEDPPKKLTKDPPKPFTTPEFFDGGRFTFANTRTITFMSSYHFELDGDNVGGKAFYYNKEVTKMDVQRKDRLVVTKGAIVQLSRLDQQTKLN